MEAVLLSGCSFAAVILIVVGLLSPQPSAKRQLRPYLAPPAGTAVGSTFWGQCVAGPLTPAIQLLERLAPAEARERLQARLDMAGLPIRSGTFLAWQASGMLLLPLGFAVMTHVGGGPVDARHLLMAVFLGCLGVYLPRYWLTSKIDKRQRNIERALPDALDLIVVSMEAGLGFDGALAKVVERTSGPLADELQRTLHEIALGGARRQALRALATRTGVGDVIALMNAVVQADEMGVSMAELMRTQAEEARVRRRQRAEEEAHKAPVKMLFPLIMCIFPTVIIVVIGPAGLVLYHQFTSGVLAR